MKGSGYKSDRKPDWNNPPHKADINAADKRFAKMEKDPKDRPAPFDKK